MGSESDARSYEGLHLSRKIISANLKIWCSKMQPLSGNQRPDLLTSLMNMSLVLHLPREMHLSRSSSSALRHNAVHFSASQLPKVLRPWCVLYILTWKCASRHNNGVHFFNISTSKSGLRPSVFYTFDFEMCFAPQRRANFASLIWRDGSAPAASLLFDPLEPQIIGKTSCFATLLRFRAPAPSFL